MSRPPSITAASWIWLYSSMLTTLTIANVVAATDSIQLITGLTVDEDEVGTAVDAVGWFGWVMAVLLFAAMVFQVVCAVKLRDGARWARTLLAIVSAFSVVSVAYNLTSWSAWGMLVANLVAVALAFGSTASAYLSATRSPHPARV